MRTLTQNICGTEQEIVRQMTPQALYLHHKDRVYQLCLRYAGGRVALAEDLTHDVFVKLLEHLPSLSETTELAPWIYRVTTNTCLSRLKREQSWWSKMQQIIWSKPTAHTETPEKQVSLRADLQYVLEELQQLPAKERVVFCMVHLDHISQQDVGKTLSLSKGYVSKLLHRAQQRLRKRGWEVTDG